LTAEDLVAALALPAGCRVNRRVPKKLLLEYGAFGAGDRRAITDDVEELAWVAVCKPTNLGVPAFRDDEREYLEIAVLLLRMRGEHANENRLAELVHRAIPYPVVLVTALQDGAELSLAHKRWSRGEKNHVVLDGDLVRATWAGGESLGEDKLRALAPAARESMFALYQGWLDALLAFQAERITGRFNLPTTGEAAELRRQALRAREELLGEIGRRTTEAEQESQMARLVALNEEIRQLRARLIEEESRL
jgi:hypothetical protein